MTSVDHHRGGAGAGLDSGYGFGALGAIMDIDSGPAVPSQESEAATRQRPFGISGLFRSRSEGMQGTPLSRHWPLKGYACNQMLTLAAVRRRFRRQRKRASRMKLHADAPTAGPRRGFRVPTAHFPRWPR